MSPSDQLKEWIVSDDKSELLQGTLEMLVLKMLALEPMHGWGMSQRIQHMSKDVILVSRAPSTPRSSA